jgi:hypothetical protein
MSYRAPQVKSAALRRFEDLQRSYRALVPTRKLAEIRSLGQKLMPFFSELKAQHAKDRKALDDRKAEFVLKPPQRDDPEAFVRAVEAWELRTKIDALPMADRIRLALDDSEIARVIIHGNPILTGIDDTMRARIVQNELEREFGADQLKAIRDEASALDVVDAALQVSEQQLFAEAGMNQPNDQKGNQS